VVGSELLGGSAIIGGVTVSREFSLQPYLIRSPALDLSGTATTPSTVEVYINGQLTNRIAVGPGLFTLRDLPATGGLGNTRLIVRDVFGRETVQEGSFYYSTAALRKGLSEYTFSAGVLRDNLLESFDYGDPAAYAQYRKGITDVVTLGGRAEATADVLSGGPRVTLATRFGDIDVSAGASRADGLSGTAGSLSYRFTAPRYSFGVAAVRRSDNYATLTLAPAVDRIIQDVNAFAAVTFSRVSLGVLGARYNLRDAARFERVALQGNTPLGRWGNLFASVGRVTQNGQSDQELLLGITVSLGFHTTADVQFQRSFGEDGVRAEIRRPLGTANGFGYALQTDTTFDTRFSSLQYQTSFGRYEIAADPEEPREATATIAGGLVYMGGALIPTRPLLDSFALARVGVPGVRVFASNQEIGKTNSRGDLLIPNLLGHYANDLRIEDRDVPLDYEVKGTNVTVVPPTRGGVIASFPVSRLQSYTGKMRMNIIGEPFTPSLGAIIVKAANAEFPLGHEGEFYIENLSAGRYPAELYVGKISCKFDLMIPASNLPLTDLGVLSCVH
jgi:outer membrane usher protein